MDEDDLSSANVRKHYSQWSVNPTEYKFQSVMLPRAAHAYLMANLPADLASVAMKVEQRRRVH